MAGWGPATKALTAAVPAVTRAAMGRLESAALLVGRRQMEGLPPRPWAHSEGPMGSELLLSTLYTFLPLV